MPSAWTEAAPDGGLRVAVMSDLHLEESAWTPPPFQADLVVLAGDIAHGTDGIRWAAETFAGRPVVYVGGNHEHWEADSAAAAVARLAAAAAATDNVRYLENAKLETYVAGRCLRILGTTLWADYGLHGPAFRPERMAFAAETAKDYRNILVDGRPLAPEDVAAWHRAARDWLEPELHRAFAGTTIVVTHHAPSIQSLNRKRWERPAVAGAATNQESLILRTRPALWIHGHTHDDADYWIGDTRIVSNQRGAPREGAYEAKVVGV